MFTLMLCLMQELGDDAIGVRRHWADGKADLDTSAFKLVFPAVNGNNPRLNLYCLCCNSKLSQSIFLMQALGHCAGGKRCH